jgi:hypothetical protein
MFALNCMVHSIDNCLSTCTLANIHACMHGCSILKIEKGTLRVNIRSRQAAVSLRLQDCRPASIQTSGGRLISVHFPPPSSALNLQQRCHGPHPLLRPHWSRPTSPFPQSVDAWPPVDARWYQLQARQKNGKEHQPYEKMEHHLERHAG